ncbi:PREDICTED: splicing factor 45 [Rhagoletis zephyria]|uniref:splicing factor 45 n=1 Tax=Rhagoletis zephyria TaxID=28612 RepID=UPI0008119620|nr:PREDICTED: splicing factor 45 [Rhagoletis zephyria]XP_036321938.1 splicing factor 45 [Rhagoletis pomonella]
MDLYDDIDTKPRASQIDGWSSGIKMLQTQLAIKKAQAPKEPPKKPLMTPVVNLRAKKPVSDVEVNNGNNSMQKLDIPTVAAKTVITAKPLEPVIESTKSDDCWDFVDEYDPMWPNEYEKLKDKNQNKEKEHKGGGGGGGGGRSSERKRGRGRNNARDSSPQIKFSGFGQRQTEEESYSPPPQGSVSGKGGAAIAPPPSLQEISINNENGDGSSNVTIPYSASSVAAKIMAKYGFKDGQGLGKQEQGMSMALQVEKTSKRGGRIIHEKDVFLPPPPAPNSPPASMAPPAVPAVATPSLTLAQAAAEVQASEPSITEIMKEPSKVVLLRNMVGPGDVDEDLEPEVKDECNTKYGDVANVIIHEAFGTTPEEAVKIFVEFKRIESAIKAVVDLNGRFFGGRQVRAGFYNFDKFKSFQLH